MLHKRAFLALEDDGTRLQGFHGVPDIFSYVHAVAAFRWVEDYVLNDSAVVVVGDDAYPAAQYNKRLLFLRMAMNGDVGTRFHGIQKTVALLIQTLMKVQIHPQPGRCLGPGGQTVKYLSVSKMGSYLHITLLGPIFSDRDLKVSIIPSFLGTPTSKLLSYGLIVYWK